MKLVALTCCCLLLMSAAARTEEDDDGGGGGDVTHGTLKNYPSFTSSSPSLLNNSKFGRNSGFSRSGSIGLLAGLANGVPPPARGATGFQDGAGYAGEFGCDFEAVNNNCTWLGRTDGFAVVSGRELAAAKNKFPEGVSGPTLDARGSAEGRFLYVGGNRKGEKDHLQIYSSDLNPTIESNKCGLKFNFHAKNILNGKVALFYENLPSINPTEINVKSHASNDSWIPVSMHVGKIRLPFRLVLEIWIGDEFPFHAAFDDIQMINCYPPSRPSPSGPDTACSSSLNTFECRPGVCINSSRVCDLNADCSDGQDEKDVCEDVQKWRGSCDFESGPCGWVNGTGNDINWALSSGKLKDNTFGNKTGHYMYLILGRNKTLGHRGTLRSVTFPPPPPQNRSNSNASQLGCQVRFYYQLAGRTVGDLLLNIVELVADEADNETSLWRSQHHAKGPFWQRVTLNLPPVTNRYYLKFVGHQGIQYQSDIAIDDFSLSPQCFTHGYQMTTCGAAGTKGPTQSDCDLSYKSSRLKVAVNDHGIMSGIQRWTVTASGIYSVTAKGAGGGHGYKNRRPSRGYVLYGVFNWTEGEIIYILVGHRGQSACAPKSVNPLCADKSSLKVRRKRKEEAEWGGVGGGGGGGGATYIFKMNESTGTYMPLLIASGGGGLGASMKEGSINPDAKDYEQSILGRNGRSSPNGTGAGGGWDDTSRSSVHAGWSLAAGGFGGKSCDTSDGWTTDGGFGGGGGGCSSGGGGGGYKGGDVTVNESSGDNGGGGYSYRGSSQVMTILPPVVSTSRSSDDGSVNIFPAFVGCDCEYMCVVFDMEGGVLHSCVCPVNKELDEDGKTCHEMVMQLTPPDTDSFLRRNLMTILPIVLILAIAIATAMFFLYHRYRRHAALQAQQPHCPYVRDTSELQLNRLRQNAAGRVTEYNPNYEFGGSMCTIQDLKEINRENLNLIKALGQGAFGEVYQGCWSNEPIEITDVPVAIKTLPELSSDQAEMDFLLEALIMSKFTHPNIVKFLGVCFEKLPKFIVLELLPGGDLKSYLRESRRKPDKPSVLSMRDLLTMAIDVAKGCQYLEENHFIHRDIAARNCLLTSRDALRVVKIADFGMARDIYRADYYRKGGKAMLPVKWMPPEAFMDGIFTSKTDVWSFGVLLWEVMSLGFMPYPGRGNQEVMQLVTSGGRLEPPPNCPGPVHQIMIQCWNAAPEERPNFCTILERLGYCLQDPHVTNAPLPVFHRPPSTERDTTIMRPPDSDVCLQVHRNDVKEPQSPSSNDYLVPIPSNYSLCTEKTELQSASSLESVDRILEMDTDRGGRDGGGSEAAGCRDQLVERMPSPLKPQAVPGGLYSGSSSWRAGLGKDRGAVAKQGVNWGATGYQSVPTKDYVVDYSKSGAVPRVPLASIPPPECSPARKSPPSAIARQRPNYVKKLTTPESSSSTFPSSELSLDVSNLQTSPPPTYPVQVVSYANVAVSNSEPVKTSSSIAPPSYIYASGVTPKQTEKDAKC